MKFTTAEGATPLDDIGELRMGWIATQSDLNLAEAENVNVARLKFLSEPIGHPSIWFDLHTLRDIHLTMFRKVWGWAGRFRQIQTDIGHPPHQISIVLRELCDDVRYWLEAQALAPEEQAARIHHRLVLIHPFPNGNGRFARLVADRYLLALGIRPPAWPSDLVDNLTARSDYISALRAADRGSYAPLLEYMDRYGAAMS